jgi:DNA-binding NarL/FixJ family response regulator
MSQILLYLLLSGFAVLLFAFTRPKVASHPITREQQELIRLLQKLDQEQAELSQVLQHRISEMERRIAEIEDQMKHAANPSLDDERVCKLEGTSDTKDAGTFLAEHSLHLSPRHKEVVNLLCQGKDSKSIAKETGIGLGEIQLLERLLQQKQGDEE